jgi:hypothetical protein
MGSGMQNRQGDRQREGERGKVEREKGGEESASKRLHSGLSSHGDSWPGRQNNQPGVPYRKAVRRPT